MTIGESQAAGAVVVTRGIVDDDEGALLIGSKPSMFTANQPSLMLSSRSSMNTQALEGDGAVISEYFLNCQ
jgi:hypothetical protein